MSLKYSSTTADYLIWSDAMNLIRKLAKDENYKISLLISLGCFTGLRISDILSLRWKQILDTDEFTVIEQKTGKLEQALEMERKYSAYLDSAQQKQQGAAIVTTEKNILIQRKQSEIGRAHV